MILNEPIAVPLAAQSDLKRAVDILKQEGCSEVFLFGSLATGGARADSDIDLAVRGCPTGRFFHLLGRLLLELEREVDLVRLDDADPFAQHLLQDELLVRLA
jgi:predicted nucleotidyltransferase